MKSEIKTVLQRKIGIIITSAVILTICCWFMFMLKNRDKQEILPKRMVVRDTGMPSGTYYAEMEGTQNGFYLQISDDHTIKYALELYEGVNQEPTILRENGTWDQVGTEIVANLENSGNISFRYDPEGNRLIMERAGLTDIFYETDSDIFDTDNMPKRS